MATRKTEKRTFEVLVSFSGLNVGDRFAEDNDLHVEWARMHVESGYLRDVTEEVADVRGEVGQG